MSAEEQERLHAQIKTLQTDLAFRIREVAILRSALESIESVSYMALYASESLRAGEEIRKTNPNIQ
jgi:predicted DNA-binding protein